MASDESNQNGECIDDMSVDLLLPLEASDACDDFGEPEIVPRIGDEFQVELPPLIGEFDHISYMKNRSDAQNGAHFCHSSVIGLPIPLMWISKEGACTKCKPEIIPDTVPSKSSIKRTEISPNDENARINIGSLHNAAYNGDGEPLEESKELPSREKLNNCNGQGSFLLPGLASHCLSDIEKAAFLVGLYIFRKNFIQLRRFIGSQEMGAVLSFYYENFYGSFEYRRWSDCLKMRSRRCVLGQKIFSGLRQQELIRHILPSVSEECQNALLEVCKTYEEEKMSLEDYVFSLKTMVGMNILVEAVGIGKGKKDLTRMAFEPSSSSQLIPIRPEIPTGRACSSLTPSEIIKFLTGDYRLSKARSNDLFWEAVWPRLLARGWHSEEPKNQGYTAVSKYPLVFLIPGIKKFSRRKLAKGDQYFDCVADVLSKVAREPGLLELETEENEGNKNKEEHNCNSERKLAQDDHDLPTRQHHCYLQPRTSNHHIDAMKFTVVDTSLIDGKPYKVRELRSLPFEISNMLTSQNFSKDTCEDSQGEVTNESDIVDTMLVDDCETNNSILGTTKSNVEMFPGRKKRDVLYRGNDTICPDVSKLKTKKDLLEDNQSINLVVSQLSQKQRQENVDNIAPTIKRRWRLTACSGDGLSNSVKHSTMVPKLENEMSSTTKSLLEMLPGRKDRDITNASVSNLKNKKNLHEDMQSRKLVMSRKLKPENVDNIVPTTKRHRKLTACSRDGTSNGVTHSRVVPRLENEMSSFCSGVHEFTKNISSQAGSSQDKLSYTSSAKCRPAGSVECTPSGNIHSTEPCHGKLQTRSLIDLNVPQVSPDFENGVFTMELIKGQDDHTVKLDDQCPPKSSTTDAHIEQQPGTNQRRQSTRNRPLTTRALEALANGFLTINRWPKKDASSRENLMSRPSQCARDVVAPNEFSNDNVNSQIQESENCVSNASDSNMCNKFQVLIDGNANPVRPMG